MTPKIFAFVGLLFNSNISVEINNITAVTYTGLEFGGDYATGQPGSITTFKDTSENDKYYYFVSDFHTLTPHQKVSISSNIYDDKLQQFNNNKNIISKQIPYEVIIDDTYVEIHQEFSCTNPVTFDIIICHSLLDGTHHNIACHLLFNHPTDPFWSDSIKIFNSSVVFLHFLHFDIEWFSDAYIIFYQESKLIVYDEIPNTYYSIHIRYHWQHYCEYEKRVSCMYIYSYNVTKFYESSILMSTKGPTDEMNGGKCTDILLSIGLDGSQAYGFVQGFFICYTNISDISSGPIYFNKSISGNAMYPSNYFGFRFASATDLPTHYYNIMADNKCCYMTSYLTLSEDVSSLFYLYVNIINGEGYQYKFNGSDALLGTMSSTQTSIGVGHSSVHQLNIGTYDEMYFAMIYSIGTTVYAQSFSIDLSDLSSDSTSDVAFKINTLQSM